MLTNSGGPLKILQVVGAMDRAGAETWLMNVLRNIDRDRFHIDFLVHTSEPRDYDEEISSLGSKIIHCPWERSVSKYALNFRRKLIQYGPYDVVHSHVHHFSGLTLMLARSLGIPIRIAHSHNDTTNIDSAAPLLRKIYHLTARTMIRHFSTHRVAVSDEAADALYGSTWQGDESYRLIQPSIDLSPFREPHRSSGSPSLRQALGIPSSACVIGHVGRFDVQKNHKFLLHVFAEISSRLPNAYLLLVGDGKLREDIGREAVRLSIQDRVVFAGVRDDTPRLLVEVMDCFVFPSLYEGLGMALVEAQAAGLRCIVSDRIPLSACIVDELLCRLPLERSAEEWAEKIETLLHEASIGRREALARIASSKMSVSNNLDDLVTLYEGEA